MITNQLLASKMWRVMLKYAASAGFYQDKRTLGSCGLLICAEIDSTGCFFLFGTTLNTSGYSGALSHSKSANLKTRPPRAKNKTFSSDAHAVSERRA